MSSSKGRPCTRDEKAAMNASRDLVLNDHTIKKTRVDIGPTSPLPVATITDGESGFEQRF